MSWTRNRKYIELLTKFPPFEECEDYYDFYDHVTILCKEHEAFELLADLRQSERVAKQEAIGITDSIVVALAGFTDFEGLPVSELNYLQVIRKLKEGL